MGIEVLCNIDYCDILEDIPTDILQKELDFRLEAAPHPDDAKKEIADALRGNDKAHLRIVLNRWMPGLGDMI